MNDDITVKIAGFFTDITSESSEESRENLDEAIKTLYKLRVLFFGEPEELKREVSQDSHHV
jgi:hypothetical protein